jgi:hypothetical protein
MFGEYLVILSPPRYFYWSEMGVLVPKKTLIRVTVHIH